MKTPTPLLGCILLLAGCSSSGLTPDVPNHQWSLVQMDIDASSMANAGSVLPIFDKPTGREFGMVPRATGTVKTADGGKVGVQVTIYEPVVNYTGKVDWLEYPALHFFGMRSPDGTRLEVPDANTAPVPVGTATVIHVKDMGRGRLRLQAATRDKLLPYVYIFDPPPARPEPIAVPFRP